MRLTNSQRKVDSLFPQLDQPEVKSDPSHPFCGNSRWAQSCQCSQVQVWVRLSQCPEAACLHLSCLSFLKEFCSCYTEGQPCWSSLKMPHAVFLFLLEQVSHLMLLLPPGTSLVLVTRLTSKHPPSPHPRQGSHLRRSVFPLTSTSLLSLSTWKWFCFVFSTVFFLRN